VAGSALSRCFADLVLPDIYRLILVELVHSNGPNIPLIVISGYLFKQAGKGQSRRWLGGSAAWRRLDEDNRFGPSFPIM
jgi:hypothetical protein